MKWLLAVANDNNEKRDMAAWRQRKCDQTNIVARLLAHARRNTVTARAHYLRATSRHRVRASRLPLM